jgi:hypothetical protein
MKETYLAVAGRIRSEVQELNRVVERTQSIWQEATGDEEDYHVDAAALTLHGFYAGWSACSRQLRMALTEPNRPGQTGIKNYCIRWRPRSLLSDPACLRRPRAIGWIDSAGSGTLSAMFIVSNWIQGRLSSSSDNRRRHGIAPHKNY